MIKISTLYCFRTGWDEAPEPEALVNLPSTSKVGDTNLAQTHQAVVAQKPNIRKSMRARLEEEEMEATEVEEEANQSEEVNEEASQAENFRLWMTWKNTDKN